MHQHTPRTRDPLRAQPLTPRNSAAVSSLDDALLAAGVVATLAPFKTATLPSAAAPAQAPTRPARPPPSRPTARPPTAKPTDAAAATTDAAAATTTGVRRVGGPFV